MKKPAGKSLTPEQRDATFRFLTLLIEKDFPTRRSQSDAAKAFGLSQGALSSFLSGKHGAGVSFLVKIAQYAKVSIEDILTGRAEEYLKNKVPLGAPIPIAIEQDPFPARIEIRKKHFYAHYPLEVRRAFESIDAPCCVLNEEVHWLQWLEKIKIKFECWVKEGKDPSLFEI